MLATGDGGFLMAIAELETAVRLGLGLVIVVYNDHAYGAEVHHFGPGLHDRADLETVVFPDTDLAAVARGYGCDGITVRAVDDLDRTDRLAGRSARPAAADRRQDQQRRRILVAGGGLPRALKRSLTRSWVMVML